MRTIRETCSKLAAASSVVAAAGPSDDQAADAAARTLEALFFTPSATQVAYTLGVIYALLMPSSSPTGDAEAKQFQHDFIKSGCGFKVIDLVTKNNFLSTSDDFTKM